MFFPCAPMSRLSLGRALGPKLTGEGGNRAAGIVVPNVAAVAPLMQRGGVTVPAGPVEICCCWGEVTANSLQNTSMCTCTSLLPGPAASGTVNLWKRRVSRQRTRAPSTRRNCRVSRNQQEGITRILASKLTSPQSSRSSCAHEGI